VIPGKFGLDPERSNDAWARIF